MIFDFHTHIFPDKIAARTLEILKQNIRNIQGVQEVLSYTEGTLSGLKASMKKNNIDYALVLPIATNTRQSTAINSYAASINGKDGILSFGSVHPQQENMESELEKIKELGLKGVKLHPEYQDIYINSPECLRVLKKCEELGLIVTVHAGADVGMKPPVKCTPQMIYDALQAAPDLTFIAAHMGGWDMWGDVKKYLVGTNIYFDTSYSFKFMDKESFCEIISNHKRILFGTDSPWGDQGQDVCDIEGLDIDESLKKKIMYENARDLIL